MRKTSQYHLIHHYIHRTQNYKLTVVEPIIRIYAGVTDYQMSVPFPR